MYLASLRHNPSAVPFHDEQEAFRVLLAVTEPPTDEEIALFCATLAAQRSGISAESIPKMVKVYLDELANNPDGTWFIHTMVAVVRYFFGSPNGT
jgi:hypothetical protein